MISLVSALGGLSLTPLFSTHSPYFSDIVFKITHDLTLQVSAMLLLAAHGKMEGHWEKELTRIDKDKEKLVQISREFYGCDTIEELKSSLRQRMNKYPFSRPYYEHVIKIINETTV